MTLVDIFSVGILAESLGHAFRVSRVFENLLQGWGGDFAQMKNRGPLRVPCGFSVDHRLSTGYQ